MTQGEVVDLNLPWMIWQQFHQFQLASLEIDKAWKTSSTFPQFSYQKSNKAHFTARCEVPVQGLESVEVREGEEAILSCTTPSEILFCTFRSPTDETFTMKPGIPYEDGRIVFHGTDEKKECGLKITNVKEKDNGEWK